MNRLLGRVPLITEDARGKGRAIADKRASDRRRRCDVGNYSGNYVWFASAAIQHAAPVMARAARQ